MDHTTLGRTGLAGQRRRSGHRRVQPRWHWAIRGSRGRDHPSGARPRGQFDRHGGGIRHRGGGRQSTEGRAARQRRGVHQGVEAGERSGVHGGENSRQPGWIVERLGLDYVDVFQLHAVPPAAYDYVRNEIVPALLREKEKGKFRFLGITETSPNDHEQVMLQKAAADTPWDTAMFAFNLMDQVARERVFPLTMKNRVGTLMMFAVRSIFRPPGAIGRDDEGPRGEGVGARGTGGQRRAVGVPGASGWGEFRDRRGVSVRPA
jgi:hypothetical protein